MIRASCLSAVLVFLPVAGIAAPNAQLLQSIESRLQFWKVGPVDYDALTTSQAAALHLKLTNAPPRFSGRAHMFRQELKTILGWDGSERKHSLTRSD